MEKSLEIIQHNVTIWNINQSNGQSQPEIITKQTMHQACPVVLGLYKIQHFWCLIITCTISWTAQQAYFKNCNLEQNYLDNKIHLFSVRDQGDLYDLILVFQNTGRMDGSLILPILPGQKQTNLKFLPLDLKHGGQLHWRSSWEHDFHVKFTVV